MATVPKEETPPTLPQRAVALWRTQARLAALAALVGALVTFSPQPEAAIGAFAIVLVAWEMGKRK